MRRLAARVGELSGEGALAIFCRARQLERAGHSVIHLELGEPDFHPARAVVQAAIAALDSGRDRYCPPGGLALLQESLATYLAQTRSLAIAPEDLIVTPGCKMALFLTMMALVEAGDEVLYPDPGFPMYPSLTRAFEGIPVPYRLAERNVFQPDPDEIAAKITPRAKIMIVNSPGNPTGTVYKDENQTRLAELAIQHDLLVVSDEIYSRILYGGTYTSIANLPGMSERTVIVDGFSKSFAMTGWRLGYIVAPPRIVPALLLIVENSYTSVAEFIQHAAVQALRDEEGATAGMLREFARRRERFVPDLNRVPGFRCAPPDGAFYAWVNIADTGLSAENLCQVMLERAGVAGIPGAAFGGTGVDFVRFSFAPSGALLKEAVERILNISSIWGDIGLEKSRPRYPHLA